MNFVRVKFKFKISHAVLIFLLALALRLISVFLQSKGFVLPDSGTDTLRFHDYALALHQEIFWDALLMFDPGGSYVWSWLLSFWYRATVPSFYSGLLFVSLISSFSCVLLYKLCCFYSGKKIALGLAFAYAGLPSSIIFGSILLRESIIIFFVLLGLLFLVKCVRFGKARHYIYAVVSFLCAIIFHPGVFFSAGLALFFTVFLVESVKFKFSALIIFLSLITVSLVSIFFFEFGYSKIWWLFSGDGFLDSIRFRLERALFYIDGRSLVSHAGLAFSNLNESFFSIGVVFFSFILSPFFDPGFPRFYDVVRVIPSLAAFLAFFLFWAVPYGQKGKEVFFMFFLPAFFGFLIFSLFSSEAWASFRHLNKFFPLVIVFFAYFLDSFLKEIKYRGFSYNSRS